MLLWIVWKLVSESRWLLQAEHWRAITSMLGVLDTWYLDAITWILGCSSGDLESAEAWKRDQVAIRSSAPGSYYLAICSARSARFWPQCVTLTERRVLHQSCCHFLRSQNRSGSLKTIPRTAAFASIIVEKRQKTESYVVERGGWPTRKKLMSELAEGPYCNFGVAKHTFTNICLPDIFTTIFSGFLSLYPLGKLQKPFWVFSQEKFLVWCQIFAQLTFLECTTCTDMLCPKHQDHHSCDSNPHCTAEVFSAPGYQPTRNHFMLPNSWLHSSFCEKFRGNLGQKRISHSRLCH